MTSKIGLVGLGLVGTAMAERLLAEQFNVIGFDIKPAKCEHLEQLGGKAVDNPAQVAEQTDRVILSLPNTEVVLKVVEGPEGILEAKTLPRYIIDTTTGDPEETAALAQRLAKKDIYFLDAPFSGSSQQVRDKEITFMVGGDKIAYEKCTDIFQTLGADVFYLGDSGNGSRAKLASNLILGLNRLALAEGLVFAGKLGLDPKAFLELLKVTPAYSAAMDVKGKKMLDGDFTTQARLRQHHKDVSIILKYSEKLGQELPLSRVHFDVLKKAIEAGDGDLDNSAVIREIERRNKL
ncbi:MAG: NAD(P)-dependent oxidoreductase [Planctomycetes bacterium]|nr:NAD(P)-dependent oxidoreductase [Planctomycetota bacterium]MBL7143772.1 NAD(P)-dependent oxidoreductase [Phycisphaerae bacterium]